MNALTGMKDKPGMKSAACYSSLPAADKAYLLAPGKAARV